MQPVQEFQQALDGAIDGKIQQVRTCIPGKIVSYDATKRTATIQLLIKRRRREGGEIVQEEIPQLTEVPQRNMRTAQAEIHFPVKANDKVLVFIHDRDVDNFRKTGESSETETLRRHDLSDAFFMPGCFEDSDVIALDSGDENNVVIYNNSTKLAITPDGSVKFGSDGSSSDNPIVLGTEIKEKLEAILDILIAGDLCLTTSPGNPTAPNPARAAEFTTIKAQLTEILSEKHFTSE